MSNSTQGFDNGDSTTEDDYQYDANGNMISDLNKGILAITYNHLNLPTKIDFGDGEYIKYTYDASGIKLKKLVREKNDSGTLTESRTEYLAGYQYNNYVLQFFPHAEGYIQHKKAGDEHFYNYVYQYKDHLGNIRLNYSYDEGNQELKIMNEHHYYPFGLEHKYYNNARRDFVVKTKSADQGGGKYVKIEMVANSGYMYKYNGKELQDELGLDWYDLGARNYDASLGRFMNADPLAEDYNYQSIYVFATNNPVYFVDIYGMGVDDIYVDKNGNYLGTDGAESKKVRVVRKETWDANGGQKGAQTEGGTEFLQKSENSTLLVGANKHTQPGYQKGISISDETWGKIEDAGGTRAEATVSNESDNLIQIKPETKVSEGPGAVANNEAVDVKSGQSVYGMVDAIATNHYSDASFKIRDGNTATVTNNGISINSYGGFKAFVGFVVGGGWGFKFPNFVNNKSVGVNGASLEKEHTEIRKNVLKMRACRL